MDHGTETMLSSTSLVGKAALPVPKLIPVRLLWWPLLRIWHRCARHVFLIVYGSDKYGWEAWRTGSMEPPWPGCQAELFPGVCSCTTARRQMLSSMSLAGKAALPVPALIPASRLPVAISSNPVWARPEDQVEELPVILHAMQPKCSDDVSVTLRMQQQFLGFISLLVEHSSWQW